MSDAVRNAPKLTHSGALRMIEAGVARAAEISAPVNIVIVDESGCDLAMIRMDGARFLSIETARSKAQTASSHRRPTQDVPADIAVGLAFASLGRITRMAGGLPIVFEGQTIGGIGVGSATDAEDITIAEAALQAIGAEIP